MGVERVLWRHGMWGRLGVVCLGGGNGAGRGLWE